MGKVYRIANRSMDKEQYDKFVSLTKEEQTAIVYNGLDPKDMRLAVEALKKVPHGNISSGNDKAVGESKTQHKDGSNKAISEGRKSDNKES